MPPLRLEVRDEIWPLREAFRIARGSKTSAHVVVVTVSDEHFNGRGEAVPYARYGETVTSVIGQIKALPQGAQLVDLRGLNPGGAAGNALDCALIDYESKLRAAGFETLFSASALKPVTTAFTISLAAPEVMATKAQAAQNLPLLKLKLGAAGDEERMRAVRKARPDAGLIADANEGWTVKALPELMRTAAEAGIEMIEQPLPGAESEALRTIEHLVPICADESVHTAADVPGLRGLYDAVNIKLDKAGGLSNALLLKRAAREAGMKIMVGSMVGTSLAVAPAMLLAQDADWTDLDGPLLLARDREHGIEIKNGVMAPPDRRLWG